MRDLRKNPDQEWWNVKVLGPVTRNHLMWAVVAIVIGLLYYNLDWDIIFGRR